MSFVRMEQSKANEECPNRSSQVFSTCQSCQERVVLHCNTCQIQVSGCFDSGVDRFGEEEARTRRDSRRLGAAQQAMEAKEQARKKKSTLWTPGSWRK